MITRVSVLLLAILVASVSAQVRKKRSPVCHFCGSSTAIATKPDAIVTIPAEFDSPFSQARCDTLFNAALGGLFPADACTAAKSSAELQTLCGCQDTLPKANEPTAQPILSPAPTPTPTPPAPSSKKPNTSYSTDTPTCHLCGSDKAIMTKPDTEIDIPAEFDPPFPRATCSVLAQAGLGGFITMEACSLAQNSKTLQELCGCQDPGTENTAIDEPTIQPSPQAPAPNPLPTAKLPDLVMPPGAHPKCNICGSNIVTNPSNVIPGPIVIDSSMQESTCNMLELAGLMGYIPKKACKMAQKSEELQALCGCQETIMPTPSTQLSNAPTKVPSDFPSDTPSSAPNWRVSDEPSESPSALPGNADILEDTAPDAQVAPGSVARCRFCSTRWVGVGAALLILLAW